MQSIRLGHNEYPFLFSNFKLQKIKYNYMFIFFKPTLSIVIKSDGIPTILISSPPTANHGCKDAHG